MKWRNVISSFHAQTNKRIFDVFDRREQQVSECIAQYGKDIVLQL